MSTLLHTVIFFPTILTVDFTDEDEDEDDDEDDDEDEKSDRCQLFRIQSSSSPPLWLTHVNSFASKNLSSSQLTVGRRGVWRRWKYLGIFIYWQFFGIFWKWKYLVLNSLLISASLSINWAIANADVATLNGRWQISGGICKLCGQMKRQNSDQIAFLRYWNWQKVALSLFSPSLENTTRQNMEDKATKNAENMTRQNCPFATRQMIPKIM